MTRPILLATMLALASPTMPALAQSVTAISAAEKAQGAEAHPQLLNEYGGAMTGRQADYVRRVGQRIAVQSGLSNAQADFTVSLLNSPVENAFAIPGGYVYVTRDLLALMNDEAELASVLGHEVAHVAARHSRGRQNTATAVGLGTSLLGALLGNSTLGQLATRGIGFGAQLGLLGYSRAQENEADTLGIRYLVRAGFDPVAASTMLASLAAQSDLEARIGGRTTNRATIFSTHPDPRGRVARTRQQAQATNFTTGVRNRDAFLAAIDGMMYGDDPAQGVVDGQRFVHPVLRLTFTAPPGYAITNATDAVTVTGRGAQARFAGGAFDGNLDGYVQSVLRGLSSGGSVPAVQTRRFEINGIPVATTTVGASTQQGPVDVTITAYAMSPTRAFHFTTIAAQGSGNGPLAPLVQSMRRLSAAEAGAVRPRRIRIVTVARGETTAALAARMAYPTLQLERFLTLNAMPNDFQVKPGQRVKLVVYG